jgi:hypothetical protein
MQSAMRKSLILSMLALSGVVAGHSATASGYDDDVVRWQSVIGIIQAGNVVGSGAGAAAGAPGPWSARGGRVKVNLTTGKIDFDVDGLMLAGGNFIGTTGTVHQVKGTLVCDTDGSASGNNSVLVDTPLVALDENGDARFNGSLAALPAVCSTEPDIAFLIRTGAGKWIANGTLLR